jgi:hypothetical protein
MLYDIHRDLGPKTRVASYEEAFAAVRAVWPGSRSEGSTGLQRSFWIGTGPEAELVGHTWEVRSSKGGWWLRAKRLEKNRP